MLLRILIKIGSVFVCAIPARYRRRWPLQDEDLRGATIASGTIEFLLGAPGTMLYVGLAVAGVILNPFLLSVFLLVEGAARLLAALSSGQILPTLPLQIVAWLHDRKEGKQADLLMGPLVADTIERGEGKPWDLRVSSCRAKPHWNPYMTIRFENQFYQMLQEDLSPGPRKFVYLLRKNPTSKLVVVVFEYDPRDVMTPDVPPRRWKP
jgi:hypothetical protein